MADYRPEDVSSKYLDSLENLPMEYVGLGMLGLIIFLVLGYMLSVKYKRWSFRRRQAKRRQALALASGEGQSTGRSRKRR